MHAALETPRRGNVSVTDPDCQGPPPSLLFSDRAWLLKLVVAIGLLSFLCDRGRAAVAELHPSIQEAVLNFEKFRGKLLLTWAQRVLSITPSGFDLETRAGIIHVVSPPGQPVPVPGQKVTIAGRLTEPRRLEASLVRLEDAYELNRGLNYALSSVTVLGFLYLIRRRFRVRLREGLFRSRY